MLCHKSEYDRTKYGVDYGIFFHFSNFQLLEFDCQIVVIEYVSWHAQCRNKHENLLILSLLLAYFELLCPLNNNCFVFHSIQYTPNRWIFHRTIHIRISYIGIKGFYHRFSNSQNNHMFGHMSAIRYFCFTNTSLFV